MNPLHPDDEIVRLAEADNSQQASFWEESLEAEGIPCKRVGEMFETGFPLSGVQIVPPEIWVRRADFERAVAVLEALPKTVVHAENEDEGEE